MYIQQYATLHRLFYLETALHVSGGTSNHQQERKQLYLQHLVFVRPLLLPAANIHVYLIYMYIQQDVTLHRLFYMETALHMETVLNISGGAGSSNGLTNTRCCKYSCLRS